MISMPDFSPCPLIWERLMHLKISFPAPGQILTWAVGAHSSILTESEFSGEDRVIV